MALFDLYSFSFLPQYIEIAGRNRVSGKTEKALAILGVFTCRTIHQFLIIFV